MKRRLARVLRRWAELLHPSPPTPSHTAYSMNVVNIPSVPRLHISPDAVARMQANMRYTRR